MRLLDSIAWASPCMMLHPADRWALSQDREARLVQQPLIGTTSLKTSSSEFVSFLYTTGSRMFLSDEADVRVRTDSPCVNPTADASIFARNSYTQLDAVYVVKWCCSRYVL